MPGMERQRVALLRHANFGAMCAFLGVLDLEAAYPSEHLSQRRPTGRSKNGGDGAARR